MTNELTARAQKVDAALRDLDKIPLFGNAPRFDIEHISSKIAASLDAPTFSFSIHDSSWREFSKINDGLGSNILSLCINLTPLAGEAIWLMGREDIEHLTSLLMGGKTRGKAVSSEILQEGFYRYLVLQTLNVLQEIEPLNAFTLKISEASGISSVNSYCIDVKLSVGKRSCWGRLVLPSHLMASWQRHFASIRELFSLSPLAKSIEVPVCVAAGHVSLSMKEWKKLEKGDFICLDRGGYDPRHHEGLALLMLGNTPLFAMTVKENKLKLLEFASYYEEPMEKSSQNAEEIKAGENEERAMAVKELTLHITVELARLKMTVDQLMKLSPGNFLELPIRPDQEVDLTVNGQKIGRGELVHLGEVLGVRVLETAE